MKIAYLILAHDNPQALARLVDALTHARAYFFIHVSGRSLIDPFRLTLSSHSHVRFVRRIPIEWMGFSLLQAILELTAAAHAEGFDYYTLLSGTDYPLRSSADLVRFFDDNRTEYITAWRIADRPTHAYKVQYHFPIDSIPIHPYYRRSGPTLSTLQSMAFWVPHHRFMRLFPKRQFPNDLEAWGGSAWWSLTRECVSYVLSFIERRPDILRFMKTVHVPDEILFHSIIMSSEFGERVHRRAEYETWRARTQPWVPRSREEEKARMLPDHYFNLRYIDWSGEFDRSREIPAVLDERDIPALEHTECLFARKLDPVRSARLIDWIDLNLRRP